MDASFMLMGALIIPIILCSAISFFYYTMYRKELYLTFLYLEAKCPQEHTELSISILEHGSIKPVLVNRLLQGRDVPENEYLLKHYALIKKYYHYWYHLVIFLGFGILVFLGIVVYVYFII